MLKHFFGLLFSSGRSAKLGLLLLFFSNFPTAPVPVLSFSGKSSERVSGLHAMHLILFIYLVCLRRADVIDSTPVAIIFSDSRFVLLLFITFLLSLVCSSLLLLLPPSLRLFRFGAQ